MRRVSVVVGDGLVGRLIVTLETSRSVDCSVDMCALHALLEAKLGFCGGGRMGESSYEGKGANE